ncbi:coiled-coil domain-containing protein 175 [Liasis olivaceus]
MAPHPPSGCSKSAAAALRHLQGVEKQLQNEGLLFNKETVQHLEDAIKAIKKLEEERKLIIELLEEETIKNCNLRIRIKGFPAIVMKEFEELVAAAHRFHLSKLSEVEASMNETIAAVQQVYAKQMLSEEQNETLCQEQGQIWEKYDEVVQLVNQQMDAKHSVNIKINECHNLTKKEEEETVAEEIAIEELQKLMASEALQFKEKKALLKLQIEELQKKLKMKKYEVAEKEKEFGDLLKVLHSLQEEVARYNQMVTDLREELKQMLTSIKELIKEFEKKKAEKEEIMKKKCSMQDNIVSTDADFDEERKDLLQQLEEADQKLQVLQEAYQKLKDENDLLNTQYQMLTNEENHFCAERDRLVAEFEKLSNMLTEKLDYMAKRVIETKNVQDELDQMQDIYNCTHDNYAREMAILEVSLKKESDKREQFQIQLGKITTVYQTLLGAHEEFLSESKQKIEAAKNLFNKLRQENEYFSKEIKKASEKVKNLTAKLLKKEAHYKKHDADLTEELEELEEEYNSKTNCIEELEKKLQENIPLSEELRKELAEISTNYAKKKEIYNELREEECTLKMGIEHSLREIKRLERQKMSAKTELKKNRDTAFEQLRSFTYSVKFIERDNYEVDRMLFILNAENARLRAGIAYLKEDISTIASEAKLYQSKRQQIQLDKKVLYELFVQKWIKDGHLQKMFFKYQRELLIILEEYIRRNRKRNVKLDYVHEGLQLNYENMESLLKSKSVPDADKGKTDYKAN